jgi:hypothetical protein
MISFPSPLIRLALAGLLLSAGCKSRPAAPPVVEVTPPVPPPAADPHAVLRDLAANYKNGEISRCTHAGGTVYLCARNAPDAGAEVFDALGKKVGVCYPSTRRVDPVCTEAADCKVIYRVSPNIWGKPGVALQLD